jgi:hypothetical protein
LREIMVVAVDPLESIGVVLECRSVSKFVLRTQADHD